MNGKQDDFDEFAGNLMDISRRVLELVYARTDGEDDGYNFVPES